MIIHWVYYLPTDWCDVTSALDKGCVDVSSVSETMPIIKRWSYLISKNFKHVIDVLKMPRNHTSIFQIVR